MDWMAFFFLFYFGCCLSSFLILVGMRVPRGESIVHPSSRCETCGHRLHPVELFPLISFLLQRGRCRQCGTSLPSLYLIMETLGGLSFCFVAAAFAADRITGFTLFLVWSFGIALVVSDVTCLLLPDSIMRVFFFSVLLFQFCLNRPSFLSSLWSGAGIFVLLYLLYSLHPDGLGGGDVKLCGVLGVLLGFQATLFVIFSASLSGLVFSLLRHRFTVHTIPLPFGPFLIMGSFLTAAVTPLIF